MTAEAKHSEPAVERAEPCPVRVGPSTIPGAGRGVFATRDIKPGELVCIYEGTARPDKPTIAQLEYECNGVIGFADPVHRDGVGQLINDVSRLELLDKLDKKMSRDERCKTIMAAINSHLLSGNRCNVHLINKPDKLQLADGKEVVRMAVAAIKEIKKNSELFLSYNCMWWLNRYYFTTCDKDMLADVEYIWSMYDQMTQMIVKPVTEEARKFLHDYPFPAYTWAVAHDNWVSCRLADMSDKFYKDNWCKGVKFPNTKQLARYRRDHGTRTRLTATEIKLDSVYEKWMRTKYVECLNTIKSKAEKKDAARQKKAGERKKKRQRQGKAKKDKLVASTSQSSTSISSTATTSEAADEIRIESAAPLSSKSHA